MAAEGVVVSLVDCWEDVVFGDADVVHFLDLVSEEVGESELIVLELVRVEGKGGVYILECSRFVGFLDCAESFGYGRICVWCVEVVDVNLLFWLRRSIGRFVNGHLPFLFQVS